MYIEQVEYILAITVVEVLPSNTNLLEIASATTHVWLVNLVFAFASLIYQGPVAWSMVSVNQHLIPWQRIGFDTA